MMRYFNTEGCCNKREHYMVPLDDRIDQIRKQYVDRGKYFVINRGRQYGKTTTLMTLAEYLKNDYVVLFMDFQRMSTSNFSAEQIFTVKFIEYIEKLLLKSGQKDHMDTVVYRNFAALKEKNDLSMDLLFDGLSKMCKVSQKPVVLMIDEVDRVSNNQIFIDFLSQLRGYYLNRAEEPIFHSVILAGVYDIKNLKLKLRSDEEHRYNSPWNIAADFDMDMSFSSRQIAAMLAEYEEEKQTGMDVGSISDCIYQYTSGYPYLVSAICKIIDEKLPDNHISADMRTIWTNEGVMAAVKLLLDKQIPLFGSMMRHVSEYPDLKKLLDTILFEGGQIANRIFETRLYNFFLSEEELSNAINRRTEKAQSPRFPSGNQGD